MDYSDEIQKILDIYKYKYYEPSIKWNKRKFKKRCVERWTCDKILSECLKNPTKDPRDILEDELLNFHYCIAIRENELSVLFYNGAISNNNIRPWGKIFKCKQKIMELNDSVIVIKYISGKL